MATLVQANLYVPIASKVVEALACFSEVVNLSPVIAVNA